MQAIYQHPRELKLVLFQGEPSFPLTILQSQRLQWGRWQADLHIIGESHAVIFAKDGVPIFSEVLACYPASQMRCAWLEKFDKMEAAQVRYQSYQGWVTFEQPGWVKPQTHMEDQLSLSFPDVHGQTPQTHIQWEKTETGLQWWTRHTYPLSNQTISVYSHSSYYFTAEMER